MAGDSNGSAGRGHERLTVTPHTDMHLTSCHLVTDRDAGKAGQPFVLQSVLTDAQLAALMIQPLFAGSNYPFGAPR